MPRSPLMIADLHCDLLTYLANNPQRTPDDSAARCSIPQLKKGGIRFQAMALFTEDSSQAYHEAKVQASAFRTLLNTRKQEVERLKTEEFSSFDKGGKILMSAALENAAPLLGEGDPIASLETTLNDFQNILGSILYISLTWNGENRFGGGAFKEGIGIKEEGKELLRLMNRKKIAVDLSHASDALAYDILTTIEKERLTLPVIASHSNARSVHNQARNLPDELIQEIIQRKGLIGLNFVRHFIDDTAFEKIREHAQHILDLGGENSLSLGADFFAAEDLPPERYRLHASWYFDGYDTAESVPKALEVITEGLGDDLKRKVAGLNVLSFIRRVASGK